MRTSVDGKRKGSLAHRLYHGETSFDFIALRKVGFALSGFLIVISSLSLFTRGLNLGIDFEGGVAWEFPSKNLTVAQTRDVMSADGLNDAKVQTLQGTSGNRIRVQVGPQPTERQTQVQADLAKKAGIDVGEVSLNAVGPSWGNEISHKAERALVWFFIAITIYITLRFEWKMAVGALVAVVHDVVISVGIYSVFGFEVSPATVIAFLTILGYSLYDTIVVFERVHKNRRVLNTGKATYGDMINLSMNQVLMRSLNTSLAAVLPVLSLLIVGAWILGAIALQDFALALLVGLITGSYSSIFIATPILAMLKEREPRNRQLRAKLGGATTGVFASLGARDVATMIAGDTPEPASAKAASTRVSSRRATATLPAQGESDAGDVEAGVARSAPERTTSATSASTRVPPRPGTAVPPRPRKKKRR